jgi:hypothetical protein
MRAADLPEAAQIVSGIRELQKKQRLVVERSLGHVSLMAPDVSYPSREDFVLTTKEANEVLARLKAGWANTEAELRRRAAQIGLTL